jgi:hypothetical protein
MAKKWTPPISEDQLRDIYTSVRGGASQNKAVQAAGVASATFERYLARGKKAHAMKVQGNDPIDEKDVFALHLFNAVTEAKAGGSTLRLGVIRSAYDSVRVKKETTKTKKKIIDPQTKKIVDYTETTEKITELPPDWKAAAWIEERIDPERFAKKLVVANTSGEGRGVTLDDLLRIRDEKGLLTNGNLKNGKK